MSQRILQAAVVAIALAVSAWVHQLAGYTFPPPWSDEAYFLLPANAFAQSNTLLAPQLNPDRHLHWMPPGYMLLTGLGFKVTGFSLGAARWFSWGCVAMSFVMLVYSFNRYPAPILSTSLLTLFFLNSAFVVIGNIGRMEALLLLFAVAASSLLQAGFRWSAFALSLASPLIHPNGLYFAVGAAAWLLYRHGLRWGRPSNLEWVALAGAALAWAAYAAYVLPEWEFFRSDMAHQFARKADRSPVTRLLSTKAAVPLAWFVVLGVGAALKRADVMLPLVLAGCSYLIARLGLEMWYRVFEHLAFLILGLASIWLVASLLERRRRWRFASVAVLALLLLYSYYRHGFIEGPRGYPGDMTWAGMKMADEVPYLTNVDVERVKAEVARHRRGHRPVRVEFLPVGDALFFVDAWGADAMPFRPLFTDVRPDLLVYRTSRYFPVRFLRPTRGSYGAYAALADPKLPFHERDGTESWYLVDLRDSSAP